MLVLLIVVGAVFVFRSAREGQPRSWTLSDGSVLSVAKVTFGENHLFLYGNQWISYLSPIVPRVWRNKFYPKVALFKSAGTNDVVIWLQRRRARSQQTTRPGPEHFRLSVFDEHGLETPITVNSRSLRVDAPDREITAWTLRSYPHRSAIIGIRLYRPQPEASPFGEFTFRNYAHQDFPCWKSEGLPETRKAGNLEITLLALESGLGMGGQNSATKTPCNDSGTRASFTLKEANRPNRDWSITRIIATSVTGDRHISEPGQWSEAALFADFPAPLWMDEPAWKLRVELTRSANFLPGETWKVTGVPVLRGKQLAGGGAMTNIQMADLEFLGLSGPGSILPARHVAMEGCWNAHLRTPYPVDDLRFSLVRVEDQLGHTATLKGVRSVLSDGGRGITPRETLYAFGFDLAPEARILELTFAITPIQCVEFQTKAVPTGASGSFRAK